jgi:hypothetical protein
VGIDLDQTISFGVPRDVCGMLFRRPDAVYICYRPGMGRLMF